MIRWRCIITCTKLVEPVFQQVCERMEDGRTSEFFTATQVGFMDVIVMVLPIYGHLTLATSRQILSLLCGSGRSAQPVGHRPHNRTDHVAPGLIQGEGLHSVRSRQLHNAIGPEPGRDSGRSAWLSFGSFGRLKCGRIDPTTGELLASTTRP